MAVSSSGITETTMAGVKNTERRYRDQGFNAFHRIQKNGTWKVYRGSPITLETVKEEDISSALYKKIYLPKDKPKKQEDKQEERQEEKQEPVNKPQSSGKRLIASDIVYTFKNEKEARAFGSRIAKEGKDVTVGSVSGAQSVVVKFDKDDIKGKADIDSVYLSMAKPMGKVEEIKDKEDEEDKEEDTVEKPARDTVEFEKMMAKEKAGKEFEEYKQRKPLLTMDGKTIASVKLPTAGQVKDIAEKTGSDIKSTISAYSKSRPQTLTEANIGKGIRAGVQRQTQVMRIGGVPKISNVERPNTMRNDVNIMERPNLNALKSESGGVESKGFTDITQRDLGKGFAGVKINPALINRPKKKIEEVVQEDSIDLS